MKKLAILFAAATVVFASCSKQEEEIGSNLPTREVTLGASIVLPFDTKSTLDPDDGTFIWSAGDKISVRSNYGAFTDLTLSTGAGSTLATFNGTIYGTTISKLAIFPSTLTDEEPYLTNAGRLTLVLPSTIAWQEGQVNNYMIGTGFEDSASPNVNFKNIGGMFKLTLNNIPVGATQMVFTANKKIAGTFTIDNITPSEGDAYIETVESETDKSITFTFDEVTTPGTSMVFYVPVPVGSYKIGFDVRSENESLWAFSSKSTNNVVRAHVVRMPELTFVSIGGGSGDNASNIIVTPTGYSGDVFLPETTSNIYVKINKTDGPISIVYGSDTKPANVYLEVLKDGDNNPGYIGELNINLPDSHVELIGQGTIDNVSSQTSVTTLVVGEEITISEKLKVEEGSLVLNGPVKELAVAIPNVNEIENTKVSIVIKSSIETLNVTQAATQEALDKIWVEIKSGATVTSAIGVTEKNCNLYVESGATVSEIVTTENETVIAGTVETLYAGSDVTVTEDAEIQTIYTDNSENIVVVENVGDETPKENQGENNIVEIVTTDVILYSPAIVPQYNGSNLRDARFVYTKTGTVSMPFKKACERAVAGQVIELTSNVDVTGQGTILVPAGVTIDFAGKSLKADGLSGNGGKFIFKQSDQSRYEAIAASMNYPSWSEIKALALYMVEDVFSFEGNLNNVEIRGGTFDSDYRAFTPNGVGEYAQFQNGYFFPAIPEARVFYASASVLENLGISYKPEPYVIAKDGNGDFVNITESANFPRPTVPNGAYIFQSSSLTNEESIITAKAYDDWNTDFVVYTNQAVNTWYDNDNNLMPSIALWGAYGDMVFAPTFCFDMAVNEKFPLITTSVSQMWGFLSFNFPYSAIKETVETFVCGTVNLRDLPGVVLNVELCITPPSGDFGESVKNNEHIVIDLYKYEYGESLLDQLFPQQ